MHDMYSSPSGLEGDTCAWHALETQCTDQSRGHSSDDVAFASREVASPGEERRPDNEVAVAQALGASIVKMLLWQSFGSYRCWKCCCG